MLSLFRKHAHREFASQRIEKVAYDIAANQPRFYGRSRHDDSLWQCRPPRMQRTQIAGLSRRNATLGIVPKACAILHVPLLPRAWNPFELRSEIEDDRCVDFPINPDKEARHLLNQRFSAEITATVAVDALITSNTRSVSTSPASAASSISHVGIPG